MKAKKRIVKVRINEKTHPCFGRFVQDHTECNFCGASLECECKLEGLDDQDTG